MRGVLIKSCPFCGKFPEMCRWHGGGPSKRLIRCENERCAIQPSVTGETPGEAARRWNKRSVREWDTSRQLITDTPDR